MDTFPYQNVYSTRVTYIAGVFLLEQFWYNSRTTVSLVLNGLFVSQQGMLHTVAIGSQLSRQRQGVC